MSIARVLLAVPLALIGCILAIPVMAIAVLIMTVNWLTRALALALEPAHVSWQDTIEFEPEVGWKPKPNMNVRCVTTADPEVFHVLTDAEGWPGLNSIEDSDVVVFGDSFAFGYGIDHRDSFLARTPELGVKAVAAPGYNLVQELILMRRLAPRLRGKLVVWAVFYGNDLYDNLNPKMNAYRTPFVRQTGAKAGWEIVTDHVNSRPWHASKGRHQGTGKTILAALHTPGWLSDRAFSACEFLLREARETCADAGASLVVLAIPDVRYLGQPAGRKAPEAVQAASAPNSSVPDGKLREICEMLSVPLVLGSAHFTRRHFRPTDPHWNGQGHERAASLIADIYSRHSSDASRPAPPVRAPRATRTAMRAEARSAL